MTEYGVQTTNLFDLLSEEGPSKAAAAQKKAAAEAAAAAAAPAAAAAAAQKKAQQAAGKPAAAGKKPAQGQAAGKPAAAGQAAGKGPAREGRPARDGQVSRPARDGQAPRRDGAPGTHGEGRRFDRPAGERGPRVNNGERPPRREGARREGTGAVATVDAEGRPVREPRQRNDRRDRPVKDRGDANAPNYEGRRPARGRVFDRHSGTGRDPTENKKGGAGKSNWGAAGKDELAAVIEAAAEPAAAGEEAEGAVAAEGAAATEGAAAAEGAETKGKDKAVEPAAPVEEDPDDKLVSFEEYQKQQKAEAAAAKKKFKQPKARSAGEGVKLDPKWANAVPLKKEDDAQPISITIAKKEAKKETKDAQPQVQLAKKAAPKEKTISAADILRFDTSRPRGEGREGGREGGRGGRGGFNREGREGGRGGFGGRGRRDGGEPTGERRPRREGQGSPAQAAPQAAAPKREAKAAPAPAITDAAQFPALGQ